MSSNDLRLQVILNAVDKITRPLSAARNSSKELAGAVTQTREQLKKLDDAGKKLTSFNQLRDTLKQTGSELAQAQLRAQMMTREISAMETPTKQQTRALDEQWRAVSRLEQKQQQETQQLNATRTALYRMGVSAAGGASETARLSRETEDYNRKLSEQEKRLQQVGSRMQKLHGLRAQREKTEAVRGKLAASGAGMLAGGVAGGALMMTPVRAYAEAETAQNQLGASMMRPDGSLLPEMEQVRKLAVALGDKLPGSTTDFINMMTMLRRQGMSATSILNGLGEATAYLGVQLGLTPDKAAEFASKLQDATQTSEKDMMSLMDVIQKGFYTGVDPDNMLQGFSKIGAAMDIIHQKGIGAAKTFAPLLVMADQSGMAGESAGNAYRKIFQATLDTKKLGKANDALSGTGIKLNFVNKKGQFAGLEVLYQQLAKINKLTDDTKKTSALKALFGDDAETMQALGIMMSKGIEGYRETVKKLDDQASLRQRVDASLKTLANKWDAASGSFTNAMMEVGNTVAPQLKSLVDLLGDWSNRLGAFVREHPQFTGAMFRIAAVIAILHVALGAVALGAAAAVGPFALLRFAAGQGIGVFGFLGKAFRAAGSAVLWLGRAMMANPILAVIGLIAAGAIWIWQNWDWLGPKINGLWTSVSASTRQIWADIKTYISGKWDEIVTDVQALPEKFRAAGAAIIDSIMNGISQKWEALKAKIASVSDMLPEFMRPGTAKGGDGKVTLPPGGFPTLHDNGGYIPSGRTGIVGEYGPELVNGPANITSRRRTASLAAAAAVMFAGMPASGEARPVHPMSAPAAQIRQAAGITAPAMHAPAAPANITIHIHATPAQSAQEIGREVARQLALAQQQERARVHRSFSDTGGYEE